MAGVNDVMIAKESKEPWIAFSSERAWCVAESCMGGGPPVAEWAEKPLEDICVDKAQVPSVVMENNGRTASRPK